MGFATRIGKYQLGRTIGEGTFAKVKLAVDSESGQFVAVKVIDKKMILKKKLMYQPENLLLDNKGNLKISDFGLSVLKKPGDLLSTACGSPSYVAPEVIVHKQYEGMAADIWSCGVILYELLAGHLPFEDRSLMNLYRKISRAEYACPDWFSSSQKSLISKILEPHPLRRATISDILEDEWFRMDYQPPEGTDNVKDTRLLDDNTTAENENICPKAKEDSGSDNFINAFQLIALSNDLDLSGLFHEKKTKLGSSHSVDETVEKIEAAAKDVCLSVERINNSKVKIHEQKRLSRSISHVILSAEVTEVAPVHCVVEISKHAGEIGVYKEFCKTLSNVLQSSA
ncbi:uncharacterized protein A4U43_C05F34670 [Asparagus officinalis]|uniref:non-specific serine/threonine protein kinase n=1 Tax=Asparagus officinalis TaxID=4686 RepID=A0A5P1F275_ASPOF|nr:uncharacterized protein A4U43_C05F34670 [Asparagus officinalis]